MGSIFDWSCIELAARGDYTGTRAEWPFLAEALARNGHALPLDAEAQQVIALCRDLICKNTAMTGCRVTRQQVSA